MKLNIHTRLALQFTLIVGTILILFSVGIYYFSSVYRESEFYSRLENKALNTARLLIKVKEVDHDLLKIIDKNSINELYSEKVMIYDYHNNEIYNSLDDDSIDVSKELFDKIRLEKDVRYHQGDFEVIGLLYTNQYDRFVVVASAYDKYGRGKLNNLKWVLLTGFFMSIAFTIIIGRIYAKRALKPMSDVVKQVEKINITSLNLRADEGNGTDEIAQLAITFNKMLNRLESAFEMQRSFVSNASHELRTPLTSITGEIEVTLMNKRSEEEYIKILHSVLEDIKNLNELSNGLLDLAKANSDVSDILLRNIRIDELLWEARSDLLSRKEDYKILIRFDTPIKDENLLMVFANEHLLKTAIINLMDNACKYSQDKKVEITIQISDRNIKIIFRDEGIGIDTEDLKKIFEPFFRAKNAKNRPGNGLGLALTRKIISIHSGIAEMDSVLNKGTTVSITLPLHF